MNYFDETTDCINTGWLMAREVFYSLHDFRRSGQHKMVKEYELWLSLFYTELYSTGESILTLLNSYGTWEADILLRTMLDGSIKFLYLMSLELTETNQEMEEYFKIIPEVEKIKEHRKAKEALDIFHKFSDKQHPFEVCILKDEEIACLQEKYPTRIQKEFDQKWAMSSVMKRLVLLKPRYSDLCGVFMTYSQTSQLSHYSGSSVLQRAEDMADENNVKYTVGHSLRILSNVLTIVVLGASAFPEHYVGNFDHTLEKINAVLNNLTEIELKTNSLKLQNT